MTKSSLSIQDISVSEIINFIVEKWRVVLIFFTCGCLSGFFYYIFFVTWIGIHNIILPYSNSPMNVVEFKKYQRYVPVVLSQKKTTNSQDYLYPNLYKKFYSPEYWQKNVKANTVLSKIDVKEMTSIGVDIDSASGYLSNISFITESSNEYDAEKNSKDSFNIFMQAGTFFRLKSLIETLSLKIYSTQPSIRASINDSRALIKNFGDHLSKGHHKSSISPQSKNGISPLLSDYDDAVINLINKELSLKKNESLILVMPQLKIAINEVGYDGIQLGKKLLLIIQDHKSSVKFKTDDPEVSALDELESEIASIMLSSELIVSSPSVTILSKDSFLISTAIGGSLGLFFALLMLTVKLIALNQYAIFKSRNLP